MRKGAKIGLGITILFVSVIVGIASIPDEVLNETTTAIENEAKIFSAPEKPEPAALPVPEPSAPEPSESVEPETQEPPAPEPSESVEPETQEPPAPELSESVEPETQEPSAPEPSESEPQSEEPEGNVIRVEIRDGVGTSLK